MKGGGDMKRELKPCPFCGSKTYPTVYFSYEPDEWHVCCQDQITGKGCNVIVGHMQGYTEVEAIKAWNKRAKPWPEARRIKGG